MRCLFVLLGLCCCATTATLAPTMEQFAHLSPEQQPNSKQQQHLNNIRLVSADGKQTSVLPPQDAGFIEVNATTNANMFYWFVESQDGNKEAPIVLWLQGGPGASGIEDGLFLEHGPFYVLDEYTLQLRNTTWASHFNMLYVDNPVGVGFSYVLTDSGYVSNEFEVAEELFSFLEGFFATHLHLLSNEFYVTGESFGGHYVPAICHKIHREQQRQQRQQQQLKIPKLTGLALGDSLVDPISQVVTKPSQAFAFGLTDEKGLNILNSYANHTVAEIQQGNFSGALIWRTMLEDYIVNETNINLMDVRTFGSYSEIQKPVKDFLKSQTVMNALNTEGHMFETDKRVAERLAGDKMRSVVSYMPDLLNSYRVLLYQGQFDLKDGAVSNESWLTRTTEWKQLNNYISAKRGLWSFSPNNNNNNNSNNNNNNNNNNKDKEKIPGGWVKEVSNFVEVVVNSAGHMSPMDQPEACFDMITRFINGQSFFDD